MNDQELKDFYENLLRNVDVDPMIISCLRPLVSEKNINPEARIRQLEILLEVMEGK